MTFRDVVIKNFKGGFQKYFAYYLSGSFSILLFFMYSTLILNKKLMERDDTDVLTYVFPITMIAIALFSVFFINYAHSAFMKGRNKEFGIYISLGIDSKELRNLINIENLLISAASLLTGIVAGALFSRLFQMVILSLMNLDGIPFYLDYKPFLLTLVVFVFIYLIVIADTFIKMRKMDISGLLRASRNSEGREYSLKDSILGSLGLIIMVLSVLLLVIVAGDSKLNSNPMILVCYIIIVFLGVFLVLNYGGNFIFHLIKKSSVYYKNMLWVTELHYKFNQNKRIIFILSILSGMTIFFVASPFSLLSLSESITETSNKNHLEYVETDTINKLPKGKLDEILAGGKVVSNQTIKFCFLNTKKASDDIKNSKPIMSQGEYNKLTGSSINVAKGEAINIIIDWYPGDHGIKPGSMHELYLGDKGYQFNFINSVRGSWIAGAKSFPTNSVVIINDQDYANLLEKIDVHNTAYYHLIKFKDWKNSKKTIEAVKEVLGDTKLKAASIIDAYEILKSGYSVFLFVSTVMGIMFFVAGGSVLYFKQYTELPQGKATFLKLFKIGITLKEMKSIVAKELLVIFFLPLLFGTFMGVSQIYLMTFIMGGDFIIKEFMKNAFIVVAIYYISQGLFFVITRNKYITEIAKN